MYTGCREINKPNSWSKFAFRDVNVYWNFIISKTENAAAVHVEPEQSEYTAYSEITLDFSQVDSMWLHDAFSNNEKITINDTTNKARIVIQSDIIINLQAKEITVTDSLQYEKTLKEQDILLKVFVQNQNHIYWQIKKNIKHYLFQMNILKMAKLYQLLK